MKLFRWKAIVPLGVFVLFLALAWALFIDALVKWGVETAGTEIVGAKVELASAETHLLRGLVTLRGLQVTNPSHPMTNLVVADQLVADLEVMPLLERKLVIDTVAIRGVRFGVPRKTSGAVEHPSPTTGLVARAVADWVDRIHLPSLSISGLGGVVNVQAISADSLATLRQAKAIAGTADSLRGVWVASLTSLDPGPTIDSANALADRLKGKSLSTLGLAGARDAAQSVRRMIDTLKTVDDKLKAIEDKATAGVQQLASNVSDLDRARQADYAYARGLLHLPSIGAPDIGPALFGKMVTDRVAPVLYWLNLAQQYMPPGLQAQLHPGPKRLRASGTDVLFPREHEDPRFLLRTGDASLTLGGAGAAAGAYAVRVAGVTNAPAVYGHPTTFTASRTAATTGPTSVRAAGVLDHVKRPMRDSIGVRAEGVTLPTVSIGALGATLDMGKGTTDLSLARRGDSLDARWMWSSSDVTWGRQSGSVAGSQGVQAAVQDIVWKTLSGLSNVQIEARLSGPLASPHLAIGTNVASAVSQSLQRELGQQVAKAEAQVRQRVDSLVTPKVAQARAGVDSVRADVTQRIEEQRAKVQAARTELETRLKALAGGLPIGG